MADPEYADPSACLHLQCDQSQRGGSWPKTGFPGGWSNCVSVSIGQIIITYLIIEVNISTVKQLVFSYLLAREG